MCAWIFAMAFAAFLVWSPFFRQACLAAALLLVALVALVSAARAQPGTAEISQWCISNNIYTQPECKRAMRVKLGSEEAVCGDIGPNGECIDQCEDERAPGCPLDKPAKPKPPAFRPWTIQWACNDIRVTVSERQRGQTTFDVGGSIIGGSQFVATHRFAGYVPLPPSLSMNGRPCVLLSR
jgi:hypothetical protein